MNYTINELYRYNEKIEKIVDEIGLDCYTQEFEVISFEDMLCYEAYVGMPSHYSHWSYGKSYDRLKTEYKYNLSGLPYEMVINSDPCIAYLMKDNTLLLQILTIAHVYGHNDFFKNNRLFKEHTNAKLTIEKFKTHADRIRDYIQDPSIGYVAVEKILDAAHAIKYQCHSFRKFPFEKEEDVDYPYDNLLEYLSAFGELKDWQRDILTIVMEESRYFLPQIETKIINEGWATFWHYTILKRLNLDQGKNIEFYKVHNNVICQTPGRLNPYHIGFEIWRDLYTKYNGDFKKLASIRELERDQSFIRKYLTYELAESSHLCEIKDEDEGYYIISEVSNDEGWKQIRNSLANSVGLASMPIVQITEVKHQENTLVLESMEEDRELNITHATETLKYIQTLWGGKVELYTRLCNSSRKIVCNINQKVSIENISN